MIGWLSPRAGTHLLGAFAVGIALLASGWAARRGARDRHRRGARIKTGPRVRRRGAPGTVTLAAVPLDPLEETKHFKLIGTTGTGKSTAITELLGALLARGDRAVIADPDGSYLGRFYRPVRGDVILNPFDTRAAKWDPFAEILAPEDPEHLAASLIAAGADPAAREWRGYARTFPPGLLRSTCASGGEGGRPCLAIAIGAAAGAGRQTPSPPGPPSPAARHVSLV